MRLYKGAPPGTYWHTNNAYTSGAGFRAASTNAHSVDHMSDHIVRGGPAYSQYISLTRSYGVARNYAIQTASTSNPGFIYEINIDESNLPIGFVLFDPVGEISTCKGLYNCLHFHE